MGYNAVIVEGAEDGGVSTPPMEKQVSAMFSTVHGADA